MTKKSLLEKAKSRPKLHQLARTYTQEDYELIEAWINDEVTITQMKEALGVTNTGHCYVYIARACREMFSKNER